MSQPPSFGPIAPFYDLLMASVPYESWVDYYELLLALQDVEPKRVLDVCCGTGTVTELLAEKGFEMTGFDLSKPMIESARLKPKTIEHNIRYEVADASTFDLGEKFDAAYSFFDSLNYVADKGKFRDAIHRVAAHLKPGGSFIFDLNTAFAFEQKMFDQHDTRKKSKVHYHWEGKYDPSTRIINVAMEFFYEGKRYEETHTQRAHRHDEVLEFLVEAGFQEIRAFDSYTIDPPRKRSDRLHYTAIFGDR